MTEYFLKLYYQVLYDACLLTIVVMLILIWILIVDMVYQICRKNKV